jgi:signal transduction histidine kinase
MDQVLRNLLSNAIKFTPKGGNVKIEAQFIPENKIYKRKGSVFYSTMIGSPLSQNFLRKSSRKQSLVESISSILGKSAGEFFNSHVCHIYVFYF